MKANTTMPMATSVSRMLRRRAIHWHSTKPTGIISRFTANWDMMNV